MQTNFNDNMPVSDAALNLDKVASLGSVLRNKINLERRFRFPMKKDEALHLLAACYMLEVEKRNLECVFTKDVVRHLNKVAAFITSDTPGFGLFLGGNVGRGKTIMMYAFRRAVNRLYDTGRLSEVIPYPLWRPQFEIHDAVDVVESIRDMSEFKRLRSLNMLGIDDLGVENVEITDFGTKMQPIMRLLEYRYNRQLFTVVTSNLTPAQMSERFDPRIADRMREMFHVVGFQSERSFRATVANANRKEQP